MSRKKNGRPKFARERNPEVERRIWASSVELRAADDDADENTITLAGHAAPFGRWSEDLGGFREIIDPGFFADVLEDPNLDTKFLVNHWDLPLAAVRSGDLAIEEDDTGLAFDASLEREDPDVDRVVRKVKPGKLDKMSFAFFVKREEVDGEDGDEWTENKDLGIWERRLLPGGCRELLDVSIVTYPAYPDTSAALRRLEMRRGSAAAAPPADGVVGTIAPGVDARRRELELAKAKARARGLVE